MKEINTSKLINYYAEALFDVANQEKETEQVFEQASFLSAELAKDPKNIQRLSNPIWSNESKKQVLTDFSPMDTMAAFEAMGCMLYERDGYVYPVTNQAQTLRDLLVYNCDKVNFRARKSFNKSSRKIF